MVFATVFAVAAALTVTPASLGAGTGTVSSTCDTNGVATSFDTSYSAAAVGYEVTTVHVTGIATPGCDGMTMKVTLISAGDASCRRRWPRRRERRSRPRFQRRQRARRPGAQGLVVIS